MPKPVIRCSQLDQLFSCGASRVLSQLVKPRTGTEAHEGILAHWMTAMRAIRELGATAPDGGLGRAEVPAGYKLPKASEWLVHFFIGLLKRNIDAANALMVETPLAYEFDRFILSGHIDATEIDYAATFANGFDWKCVYKAVAPANQNSQGLGYIVLKKLAWPTLQKVAFTFAQPRVPEEDGHDRVSTVEVEGEQLDRCVSHLEQQVNDALDRHDEINSGMTQCAWCPVGIQCPAIQAELENMKIKLSPEMLANIRSQADDGLLGDMIIASRTVGRAVEDAETLLHERLDKVESITAASGVTIRRKETNGHYTVTDPTGMLDAINTLLPRESVAEVLRYSTTRIRDEIAEVMDVPKTGKASITAQTVFDAKLRPYLEQHKKHTLVFA